MIKRDLTASSEGQITKADGIDTSEKRLRIGKPEKLLPFISCPFRNCPQPGMRSEQRNGYARLCTPANGSVLAFTAL
jgi:hypothetical protein